MFEITHEEIIHNIQLQCATTWYVMRWPLLFLGIYVGTLYYRAWLEDRRSKKARLVENYRMRDE